MQVDVPFLLMGNFNEVLRPEQRKGGTNMTNNISDFKEWVNTMEFIDMPLLGRKFTWLRGQACSRLD